MRWPLDRPAIGRPRRPPRWRAFILVAWLVGGTGTAPAQEAPASGTTSLETVVVTATRTERALLEVPSSIAVREIDELRRNGFTFGGDEYRGVAGVFFRRGEGDGDEFPFVSFRGSTGTEGSLSLIDGIPIVGLYEETQLNEIPYDAISQIEIVKGPVSALYGRGALYGATNYITRRPGDDRTSLRMTGGADDFYRGELALERRLGERAGALLTASYEDYGGWREQGGRRIWNVLGKVQADLGENTRVAGYLNLNDRDSELPNGRALDGEGNILPFEGGDEGFLGFENPNNQQESRLAAAKLEHRFSERLSLAATGSYRSIDRNVFLNFFDPFGRNLDAGIVGYNGFRGDTTQDVFFGEATVRWTAGRHDIIAGISAERSDITEFIRWTGQNGFTPECGFTFYLVEVDFRTGAVLNRDHPCFVVDETRTRTEFDNRFYGVFVQDEITLTDRLGLTLGLRYDDFSRDATFLPVAGVTEGGDLSGDADAFSPKATLSYLTDWGQLYFAYGRGFNSNFGATFEWDPVQYARPESRPTVIDSYELGLKGAFFRDRLFVETALFFSEQTDRRQIVNNPAAEDDFDQPPRLITYGDVYRSRGLELSAALRPTDRTTLQANYTYLDPEWDEFTLQTFGGPLDFSGLTPTGVPEHLFFVQLDQRVNDWLDLRAAIEFYDDYFYTTDNAFEDGGYELTTLGARIAPGAWKGWTLDVTLMNAFDESYYYYFGTRNAPTYAVPGPPRQLRLALTGSF